MKDNRLFVSRIAFGLKANLKQYNLILLFGVQKIKYWPKCFSDLPCQVRWHGISYLDKLASAVAKEMIVVRERLQPSCLAYGQTSALGGIRVYVIVSILRDMAGYCRGRRIPTLNAETVTEFAAVPICVCRGET